MRKKMRVSVGRILGFLTSKINKNILRWLSSYLYFFLSLLVHLIFLFPLLFKNLFFSLSQKKKPQILHIELTVSPVPSSSPEKSNKLPEKKSFYALQTKNKKRTENLQKEALKSLEKILAQKNTFPPPVQAKKIRGRLASFEDESEHLIHSLNANQRSKFSLYLRQIKEKLYKNWKLPSWLDSSKLKTHIVISIDEKGEVFKKKILLSSKNLIFDTKALKAIEKASPLPSPPKDLLPLLSHGLILQFPK